jgi:predicted nuclease of predicted toxin-antitoxin system
MKLLFDQNISFRVVTRIEDLYPGSKQLQEVGLHGCKDIEIWDFAKSNAYTIVTFDSDFYDFSLVKGIPPKIIWLRLGNSSTRNIADILRKKFIIIKRFIHDDNVRGCLEID